jgi:phosphoglucosamine mutase
LDFAYALGKAAVAVLGDHLLCGRDTRISGPALEAAFGAGVKAAGGTFGRLGIIPTPAVALLARELGADAGVVISASHNPAEYNGIKFFDAHGYKLSEETLQTLEGALASELGTAAMADLGALEAQGRAVQAETNSDAVTLYIKHCRAGMPDLSGLHIALDCANGAAALTSPPALEQLGAKVTAINTHISGEDINLGAGSTHMEGLQELVRRGDFDLGIAHDGDADRVLFCDSQGQLVDGDQVLAICGKYLKEQDQLEGNGLVGTVMSNLGLERFCEREKIAFLRTPVGDSNVLDALRKQGYVLGGEQSGHTIFYGSAPGHNSTGDGLLTTLQLLRVMLASGSSLAELAAQMPRYPQALVNVKVEDKTKSAQTLKASVRAAEAALAEAGGGRVLVRPSGTEPLLRIMVEAESQDLAGQTAQGLASLLL